MVYKLGTDTGIWGGEVMGDKNNIIKDDIEKITVFDTENNEELAVITDDNISTANSKIVVKIKFKD